MHRDPRPLDRPRFVLLDRLTRELSAAGRLTPAVRAAVDVLTADADPSRASRLALGPDEPPVLAERLAVWALHRAGDDAVARAGRRLDTAERASTLPVGEARLSA